MNRRVHIVFLAGLWAAACAEVAPAPSSLTEGTTRPSPTVQAPQENPRVAQLPAASREVLRRARLPLMLPRDPALLANAIVTAGPHFTALSAQGDGFSVSISGTDHRHPLVEELPPPQDVQDQVRGEPAVFTQNDGIRTVTWDEATIAWAVDVECFDPEHDARCTSDDFVRALAEGLEMVGGAP